MPILPDHAPHKSLEQEVTEYLIEQGFALHSATYHDTMPPDLTRVLQRRFSTTALYLRSRADRIAVHRVQPVEFEWEVKTHDNPLYHDLTLEAFPLFVNANRQHIFGIRCLYVFQVGLLSGGFWSFPLPPIRSLYYPDRTEWQAHRAAMGQIAAHYRIPVQDTTWTGNGSGDPYIIINNRVITEMPHWKVVIADLLDTTSPLDAAQRKRT